MVLLESIVSISSISELRDKASQVKANIERVVVGKGDVIDLLLVALLCQGHVLIEDVPGIGKTTLAKAAARSLGCSFKRIQFTPDLMPSDITGINYFNQKRGEFEFRPGPIIAQVVLADEINRATPRTQAALLEAMQERQITVDGVTEALPRPFIVLATQNPVELEGTFPLPEAELDRFLVRVKLGYPSESEEADILLRFQDDNPLDELPPVLSEASLLDMQRLLSTVHCEESLRIYVVRLCQATRGQETVELGASPRATLSLYWAARAYAAIHGNDYVTPDDVKHMAPYVLSHRIVLNSQTRLRGREPEDLVRELVETVPVPV